MSYSYADEMTAMDKAQAAAAVYEDAAATRRAAEATLKAAEKAEAEAQKEFLALDDDYQLVANARHAARAYPRP
jgi:hypothetical protein